MIIKPIKENIEKIGTPEQRAVWRRGLRSGKYVQFFGAMCCTDVTNSACCLHVAAIEVDGYEWEDGHAVGTPLGLPQHQKSNFSFQAIRNGFDALKVAKGSDGVNWSLVELNDSLGLTFNQIADIIELKEVEIDE